jgi:hypothetical protein
MFFVVETGKGEKKMYQIIHKVNDAVVFTYKTVLLSQLLTQVSRVLTDTWLNNPFPDVIISYKKIVHDNMVTVNRAVMKGGSFRVQLYPASHQSLELFTINMNGDVQMEEGQ